MTHPSRFVRAMSAVADFSHPFYAEERQRQVWNEAQTVGMQLTLWLGLGLANVMVWTGDREVAVYAVALVVLLVVASFAIVTYARSLGVEAGSQVWRHPVRTVLSLVLYLGFVVGAVVTLAGRALQPPTVAGMVLGAVAGILGAVIADRRQQRRLSQDPDSDEFDDELQDRP